MLQLRVAVARVLAGSGGPMLIARIASAPKIATPPLVLAAATVTLAAQRRAARKADSAP